MAIAGTVEVTGIIAPTSTGDTYPVTDTKYGLDGLRNVASISERNAISDDRRRQGMIVGVNNLTTTEYWRLKPSPWNFTNDDWVMFPNPYKVYSALLNQTRVETSSGTLVIGNKYMIPTLVEGIPIAFNNLIGGIDYIFYTYSNGAGDGALSVDIKTVNGVITEVSNGLGTGSLYVALDTFVVAVGSTNNLIRIDTVDIDGIPLTFTVLNGGTNNYATCSRGIYIEFDTLLGIFQSVTINPQSGTLLNFEVGDEITIFGSGTINGSGGSFEISSVSSDNFSNVGYVSNGTIFTATTTTPTTWLYSTIVLNITASAPVPTIMENTLGNIVWTYVSNLEYRATLANAFKDEKTLLFFEPGQNGNAYNIIFTKLSESVYKIQSGVGNIDNLLNNSSLEIRVYG